MRLLFIVLIALCGTVVALDRYSAAGLRTAREECRRQGILRIVDRQRWRMLAGHPEERRRLVKSFRDVQPDERFRQTIYQTRLDGTLVAELNVLRFVPVSLGSKIGIIQPSAAYICAWDERRTQYLAIAPLFF